MDPADPSGKPGNSIGLGGWISVGYDDDSIDIVWNHMIGAMLHTMNENPELIEELSKMLMEGVEHLVVDSLKGGVQGGENSDPNAPVIDLNNLDDIWNVALDAYLSKNVATYGTDKTKAAIAFFNDLMNENMSASGSRANDFTDYVCGLLKLAVNSSSSFTVEDLKNKFSNGAELKEKLDTQIHDVIIKYAKDFIKDEVEVYIEKLKTSDTLNLTPIQQMIQDAAVDYARNEVLGYLSGGNTDFDTQISDFLTNEAAKVISTVVGDYAAIKKGTMALYADGTPEFYAYGKVDEYVERAVDECVKSLCNVTVPDEDKTLLFGNATLGSKVDAIFTAELNDEFDDIVTYIENGKTGTKPVTYDIFAAKFLAESGTSIDSITPAELAAKKNELVPKVAEGLTADDYDEVSLLLGDASSLIARIDPNDFSTIISAVDADEVSSIIANSLSRDAAYNSALTTVVNSVSKEEIASFLTKVVRTNGFDTSNIIASVEGEFDTITDEQYNKAYKQFFGDSVVVSGKTPKDVVEGKIEIFEDIIAGGYDKTLAELEQDTEFSIADLLTYLQSMTVTVKLGENEPGTPKHIYVFENGQAKLQKNAIKSLIKELPLPEDIAEMEAEDMKICFSVNIVTDFSEANFDINISVGNNYDKVRKFFAAVTEVLNTSREDGKITVNLDLFENFDEILNDFITSDKISPELRVEIFDLMDATSEEIYDYVSDKERFTFAKYKSIISAIDFEAIFKNFGIENDENVSFDYNSLMVGILCGDEENFENIREKIATRFESVPESLKGKTIFNIYDGDGRFSYEKHIKLSVSAIATKVCDMIPLLKDFKSLVKSMAGNRVLESDVEIIVNGPKLYKVTYNLTDVETGEVITKTGLLPAGLSVQGFFSPAEKYAGAVIERYNGYRIEKWALTPDGEAVTTIPENDVVLYATLEKVKAEITVYNDRGFVVDGDVLKEGVFYGDSAYYVLEANAVYTTNVHTPSISYQWYKDSTLLVGKTGKTLEVSGAVISSGTYWCEVTINNDGDLKNVSVCSEAQVITINPKRINIADYGFEWNYNSAYPFTYDGQFHNVALTHASYGAANAKGLPVIIPAPTGLYTNVEKIDAGVYYARANFIFEDDKDASNYVFVNSDGKVSDGKVGYVECEWEIKPQPIYSAEGFKWSLDDGEFFTYEYGTTYSVTLSLPEGLEVERYENDAATNAGDYTAVAYIKSSNPNYVWSGENLSFDWSIKQQKFNLSEVKWNYETAADYVYNASEQAVYLTDVPADIVWIYSGETGVGAGSYVANAEPDYNNPLNQNYIFEGSVPACEWTIEKQTIESLLDLGWTYKESFTYNGSAHSVVLNLPEGFDDRIIVTYKENSAVDAGTYTATAQLVALDAANFEVVGEKINFECTWTIDKAVIDMSGVSFNDKTVYETGAPIGIEIEGTLPEGVTVEYSEPVSAVGEYEMTATFIYDKNNYEPIAPMTAKLVIKIVYPLVNEFVNKDSSGNAVVEVKAENGIPSNNTLSVSDVSAQYYGYDFGNLFGYGTNGKIISVYDICFRQEGTEFQINDVFTVKLALPDNFNGDINKVRVVHIGENGELEDMPAQPNGAGEYVEFITYHFSVYAVVEIVERVEVAEEFDLMTLLPYGIAALAAIILLIIIIIVIKKKRKKNKPEAPKAKEEPKPEPPKPEAEAEAEAVENEAEAEATEEAPSEDVTEETVTEEVPEEEEKPSIVIHDSVEDIKEDVVAEDGAAAAPEIVHVRCRSSFTSRLIQSEPPIQDYYTILKNALLSYKGVKARMSFNFESFNSGRVQCAKLNVKGKSFLVYLGLDLEEYNVNKYHFSDASDKPKFEKVPMMLKVKSDRSLRYALELIDEVMKKNGFEKDPKFQEQDYHMPYETTAALAEKELVKLILPQGVSLAEGIKLVKMDVGALLDEVKSGDDDDED